MAKHFGFFLFFVFTNIFAVDAQQVEVRASNQPLSELLQVLKTQYDIQFSYNDKLLKNCIINQIQTYTNPEQAIADLLALCHLSYDILDNVFIIYKNKKTPLSRQFQGQIIDKNDSEPLVYSFISINDVELSTDINGHFSFNTKDSLLHIKVHYLGYYPLDTICAYISQQTIALIPRVIDLKEVIVQSYKTFVPALPSSATKVKINHKVATFLPGNSDNSLFNLLRLQAGIMAAGEQTKDFFIWGSYKGQTQIVFDGITLFSTSSLNDDIGAVNPLIIKDIEVHKGGYAVDIGDRVGGFVNITSKTGNKDHFHGNIRLNNQTASGHINIPLSGKLALQSAFRKTYFNNFGKQDADKSSSNTLNAEFGDLNIKLAGNTQNGSTYSLNLMGSNDEYVENILEEKNARQYFFDTDIKTDQLGGAFFYGKKWKNGHLTNTNLAYSQLSSSFQNFSKIQENETTDSYGINDNSTENGIAEFSLKLNHFLPSNHFHSLSFGGNLIQNTSTFEQDSIKKEIKNYTEKLLRVEAYLKDNIRLTHFFSLEPGIKITIPTNNLPPALQASLRATIKLNNKLKASFSYGNYRQYIAENPIVDNFNNYLYLWNMADDKFVSELRANHYVSSLSYRFKKVEWKAEAYYKRVKGLSRFIPGQKANELMISTGKSKTYGLDLQMNIRLRKHSLSLAYTQSKTSEYFDYFMNNDYQRSPQDQRHELKAVGIFNFYPFYFSINYVYGSGFPNAIKNVPVEKVPDYRRLDVALLYKFKTKKINLETGASILNMFNHKNVRYNNFSNFSDDKTIYASATPLTPTIFINIGF